MVFLQAMILQVMASWQILTLRSSIRLVTAPHHRSPASAIKPAGQDLGSAFGTQVCRQYRSNRSGMPVLSASGYNQ
jgi:hypothetical protein